MKRLYGAALVLLPALTFAAALATGARIQRASDLRDGPYADAKVVAALPGDATVDVLERKSGWYKVKGAAGEGWVRMSSVRLADVASSAGGSGGFLFSGRAGARGATATTGVRGLSPDELKNASPNPVLVDGMEANAAAEADARSFASRAPVTAVNVEEGS